MTSNQAMGDLQRACYYWKGLDQQARAWGYLESNVSESIQQAFAERWRHSDRPTEELWINTAELLWRLLAKKYSARASAAIAGNAAYESDYFRADTEYSGGGGRGWLQWTGLRRVAFEAWCKMKGLSPTSLDANAGYIIEELSGRAGNHWSPGKSMAGLEQEGSIQDASDYFARYYLRPFEATANYPDRARLSELVLASAEAWAAKPINLVNVPMYFDSMPYQIAALKWLESKLTAAQKAEFLRIWRSAPDLPIKEKPKGTEPINWSDGTQRISKFFTVAEVTKGDSRRRPVRGSLEESNILRLADRLDRVREKWGPIGVTSWYRPAKVNAEVGGVANSTHIQGIAADIYPMGADPMEFENWLDANWVGGVGYGQRSGRGFTHVNLVSATQGYEKRVRWNY